MPVRIIIALVLTTAALLLLAPSAVAAPVVTARIRGVEYAATSTQGRFGGAANGQVRGAWQATVVHDPLGSGRPSRSRTGPSRCAARSGRSAARSSAGR